MRKLSLSPENYVSRSSTSDDAMSIYPRFLLLRAFLHPSTLIAAAPVSSREGPVTAPSSETATPLGIANRYHRHQNRKGHPYRTRSRPGSSISTPESAISLASANGKRSPDGPPPLPPSSSPPLPALPPSSPPPPLHGMNSPFCPRGPQSRPGPTWPPSQQVPRLPGRTGPPGPPGYPGRPSQSPCPRWEAGTARSPCKAS